MFLLFLALIGFLGGAAFCFYTSFYLNGIARFVGAEMLAALGFLIFWSWMHAESFSYDGIQLKISKYWGLCHRSHAINKIECCEEAKNGNKPNNFLFKIKGQLHSFEVNDPDSRNLASLIAQDAPHQSNLFKVYSQKLFKLSGIFIGSLGTIILLTALIYKLFCIQLNDADLYTIKGTAITEPQSVVYKAKVSGRKKYRKYENREYVNIYIEGYQPFVFEHKEFFDASEKDFFLTNVGEGDSLYITLSKPLYEHRLKYPSNSQNFLKDLVGYYNIPVLGLRDAKQTYLETSHYIHSEEVDGNFGAWTFMIIGFIIAGLGASFIIDANI